MIRHTAEIRWWSDDDQLFKTRLAELFSRYGNQVEERTDLYLKSDLKNTGIKLREGRLELKWLKHREDFTEGRAEYYIKETLSSEMDLETLPASDWIKVKKNRRQIFFGYHDGLLQPANEEQKEGCSIEIAEIEIDGAGTFFTACFEASSDLEMEKEILSKSLIMLEGAPFSEKPSCGYAQFLSDAL